MTYGDYPDLAFCRKILVIKLRHLGDVLLATPVFHVLKRAFPAARVDAYLYEEAKPMLEGHPAIGHLMGYDRSWKKQSLFQRFKQEAALLRRIRHERYDLVLNLTEGDRGAIAAKVSQAPVRVGFDSKGSWQKKLYSHLVKHCPTPRHVVEKNLDVLLRIGLFPNLEERELFFHVPSLALQAMRDRVGEERFILLHPTSRWRFKCWPVGQMRGLAERLMAEGRRIVITSGPDPQEVAMAGEIARGFPLLMLAGRTSLKELGALIQLSELLICVDSVALHIASALKTPVVAIFGPTSEVAWGPWRNSQGRVVANPLPCRPCYQDGCGGSKHSDCLHNLSVDRVMETISYYGSSNNKF